MHCVVERSFDDLSSNASKYLFVNKFHVFDRWCESFVKVVFSGIRVFLVKLCGPRSWFLLIGSVRQCS